MGEPRSFQSANTKAKELWKRRVGERANAHAATQRDFYFIDARALAVTIFYFPPWRMQGDLDNIVKLIIDGMGKILYPDDQLIERIEPRVEWDFISTTPTLAQAVKSDPPVVYIRIDDDLSWRRAP
jgi:Holliday junction resolvase RusA-like endonuclease